MRMSSNRREAQATRRRESLLVRGEEPQQLKLLARREQRVLFHRPLAPPRRQRRASEGRHAKIWSHLRAVWRIAVSRTTVLLDCVTVGWLEDPHYRTHATKMLASWVVAALVASSVSSQHGLPCQAKVRLPSHAAATSSTRSAWSDPASLRRVFLTCLLMTG